MTDNLVARALPVIEYGTAGCDEAFVASLKTFGFAAFSNHPLDVELIQRIYRDWRAFFQEGEKSDYVMDRDKQDGYFSLEQAEHAKGFALRDYKEYYHYYPWGRCPESLKADLAKYYEQAVEFAQTLLTWVEKYSPSDVAQRFSEPLSAMIEQSEQSLLRVLHYPPMTESQHQLPRAAPHEDINFLTILPAADGPGLEILSQDGEWISVPNRPDQVLINIGDMLQEVSAGYFPSTTHRVATPTGEDMAQGRMSLPLFLHPRPDVVLSPRHTANSYLNERLLELGVA